MHEELMVIADRYQLLVPKNLKKGEYDKNGAKKLMRKGIQLSRRYVEGRNQKVNNELYVIDEEATAKLPELRAAKLKKRVEAKAMENVSPVEILGKLSSNIEKIAGKNVEEANIVEETLKWMNNAEEKEAVARLV